MSSLREEIAAIAGKLPEDKRHAFLGAAYADLTQNPHAAEGKDPKTLEICVSEILDEWEKAGEREWALHAVARAFMSLWPDFEQLSLDEWISEYRHSNKEDWDGNPVTHPLLSEQEGELAEEILSLFRGNRG